MININMPWLQGIANGFMHTPVTISHISTATTDPTNRTGDDILEYSGTTQVMGWFVEASSKSITQNGGMATIVDAPTVRVPVGTNIKSRDKVTIAGQTWTVIDASDDETWPVFIKASLARIE